MLSNSEPFQPETVSQETFIAVHNALADLGHKYQPEYIAHLADLGFSILTEKLRKSDPALCDLLEDVQMLTMLSAYAEAGNLSRCRC